MAARTLRFLPIAEVALRARYSPRQMRRVLHGMNGNGKLLVRRSTAGRAKLWVDVKELQLRVPNLLEWINEPLDEKRVRQIVDEVVGDQIDRLREIIEKILQRIATIEKSLAGHAPKKGRNGTE